jgi:hypothetical protein
MNITIRFLTKCALCNKRIIAFYIQSGELTKEELIEHDLCSTCYGRRLLK